MAARKRPSGQNLKSHRSYTTGELATVLRVSRGTIHNWMRSGLEPIEGGKPLLFLGRVVKGFLSDYRQRHRSPCGPDEIYCLGCRKPQQPAGGLADLRHNSRGALVLSGICPSCEAMMFRVVAQRDVPDIKQILDVNESADAHD